MRYVVLFLVCFFTNPLHYWIIFLAIFHWNMCSCLGVDPDLFPERKSGCVDLMLTLRKMCDNSCFGTKFLFISSLWVCCPCPFSSCLPKHVVLYHSYKIEEYINSTFLTGNIPLNFCCHCPSKSWWWDIVIIKTDTQIIYLAENLPYIFVANNILRDMI